MMQPAQNCEDFFISAAALKGHCLGVAAAGGGRRNFYNVLIKQQIMRGGGVLFLDAKNTQDSLSDFLNLARQHNRWHDARVINIGDPLFSNTYNPLQNGDADEISRRLMALQGQGDEISLGRASRGLRAIVGALKAQKVPFNLTDIACLIHDPVVLVELYKKIPPESGEMQDFKAFVADVSEEDDWGGLRVSAEKLAQVFGGLYAKIHPLQVGDVGQVISPRQPEVNLCQSVNESELVYVALPLLGKAEMAVDFARLVLSELRAVMAQNQRQSKKSEPPFLVIMDEFGSYAQPSFSMLFEQASSAGVCLVPFIQRLSDLSDVTKGLGEDFETKVLLGARNKIVFNLQDTESCKKMSQMALNVFQMGNTQPPAGVEGVELIDSPSHIDFNNLDVGEVYFMERRRVTKVQIPLLVVEPDGEGMSFPKFDIPVNRDISMEGDRSE